MAIEKIHSDHPILQSKEFRQDIVSFNVMLIIIDQPNSQLFSNQEDVIIVMSPEQDTVWVWTVTDLPSSHREEMWQFIEYLCMGKRCRVFMKSVLVQRAQLDLTAKSMMYAYQCRAVLPIPEAHGEIRQSGDNDLYVIANMIEQCDNLGKDSAIAKARRYLDRNTPYLWTDNGDSTVALAVLKPSAAGYTRIGGVYTRPDCRNMGYEKSLIHRITVIILESGQIPMLYASDTRANTNSMYTGMGYIRCGKIAVVDI